jgi:hypothetical protein
MATILIGWTGTWTSINESTRDDSDFIRSHILPLEETLVATFEAGLSDLTDPTTGIGHVMRYAYKKSATSGRTIALQVELLEGATARATRTHSNISANWTQADETLTIAEADAITDYTDLRMKFTFTASGTGTARSGMISWAELEAPAP